MSSSNILKEFVFKKIRIFEAKFFFVLFFALLHNYVYKLVTTQLQCTRIEVVIRFPAQKVLKEEFEPFIFFLVQYSSQNLYVRPRGARTQNNVSVYTKIENR